MTSRLIVNSIRHTGGSADAVTLASDGTCTANITNNLSNRNVVINGEFRVNQRGDQTGITSSNFALDRWNLSPNNGGTWSVSQSTDTPNEFANSIKLDCTTADASLGAGDYILFRQKLEGQDCQAFAKGTSSAKQFAVSFYVKTNKSGVYTVELRDNDNSRTCAKTFTVSDANWNRYTLIFPADTTGVLGNDNGDSLQLNFWLGAGSNLNSGTLQTSWGSQTNANRVSSSNVNLADSTSNEWLITGIQLEVDQTGSGVATDFEHRSFGQELDLCRRYCQVLSAGGNFTRFALGYAPNSSSVRWFNHLRPEMRSTPSFAHSGSFNCQPGSSFSISEVSLESASSSPQMAILLTDGNSGMSAGQAISLHANGDTNAKITFSSEL